MPKNLTPPRVPLTDPQTGLITRAWFLFFNSLTNTDNADVEALLLAPPVIPATADDSGWAVYVGGVYNVKNYGAVGDGVTDDSAAIQAAVNACLATGKGTPGKATVYFPPGAYRLGTTIFIPNSLIQIKGEGASGVTAPSWRGSTIIDGGAGTGFYFTGFGDLGSWTVSDLGFTGFIGTAAIRVRDTYEGLITNCGFYDMTATAAVYLQNCGATQVTNCQFSGLPFGVYDVGGHNNNLSINSFYCYTRCVELNGTFFGVVADNTLNVPVIGIWVHGASQFPNVSINTFDGGGDGTAIKLEQATGTNLNACVNTNTIKIIDVIGAGIGIDVSGAQNCSLQGNVIDAVTAIRLAVNGAQTCGGTYYNANIFPAYVAAAHGLVTVGGGVTATAGANINGV